MWIKLTFKYTIEKENIAGKFQIRVILDKETCKL